MAHSQAAPSEGAPSEAPRSTRRCATHNLAYDPATSVGCVLCQRDSAGVQDLSLPVRRSIAPLLLLFTLLALLAGILVLLVKKRAAIHELEASVASLSSDSPDSAARDSAARDSAAPIDSTLPAAQPEILDALHTKNSVGRSGAFYLPPQGPTVRAPLLVAIHATGASGGTIVDRFRSIARRRGIAILGPDSRFSPDGQATWQVGDAPHKVTEDLQHITTCLHELQARHRERLDMDHVMIIGYSGGGSTAPYLATRLVPYEAFAVLHGGVFAGGLGERRVRGWFSTGRDDPMRPPAMVREAAQAARSHGLNDIVFREFIGAHGVGAEEMEAAISWWLGPE